MTRKAQPGVIIFLLRKREGVKKRKKRKAEEKSKRELSADPSHKRRVDENAGATQTTLRDEARRPEVSLAGSKTNRRESEYTCFA